MCAIALTTLLCALPGCPETGPLFGDGGSSTTTSTGTTSGQGGQGGSAGTGPVIRIHLRANTDPFAHMDGLSGQTPITHVSGIRKFQLYKDPSDPSPITVFDHGDGYIEGSYGDGDDTVVGQALAKALPAGTYTMGRVVHSHVRYEVSATVHAAGLDIPGQFENLQIMSDHTTVGGVTYSRGHYEYAFHVASQTYTSQGEGAPEPQIPDTGGFSVKVEDGQWAYYFPTSVVVVPDAPIDVDMVMEVNMFESFRWMDQPGAKNTTGVFDVTPPAFEPVLRFGANSFDVYAD